jgi:Tfp pilus assembly protein PilF
MLKIHALLVDSIKGATCLPLEDSMHECTVCGLLFLGGSACPSCGSLSNQELDVSGEGKDTVEQRGGIPGLTELDDAMRDVVGEEELFGEPEEEEPTGTSLPFTIGGGASEEVSHLPFGVGSRSAGISVVQPIVEDEVIEDKTESVDSNISAHIEEIPSAPDVVALPEEETPIEEESPIEDSEEVAVVEPIEEVPIPQEETPIPQEEIPVVEEDAEELEQVPLPTAQNPTELETVPLPTKPEKPVKVKAVAIIEDEEPTTVSAVVDDDRISVLSDAEDGHYQIQAKAVDMDELYAEPEHVIEHTFEDEELTSEVVVNLDDYPDEDISADAIFAPELDSSEPDLFPAQALEIDTQGDAELETLLSVGFNALSSGHWDQAARSFRSMAAKRPGDASILNNYGLALLQHATDLSNDSMSDFNTVDSQYEAAIMALRQAAKSNPEEALILYNLGTALVSSGRHEKAIRILDVVLERPDSPKVPTFNARAAAHMGMGSFEDAQTDLNSALKRDPGNEMLLNNLTRVSPN